MKINIPFENRSGVIVALVIFGIAFFLWRCAPANADEAVVSVGATYTSGFNGGTAITYSERLAGKWDLGVKLISKQSWKDVSAGNNLGFFLQRVVKSPSEKFELGIGGAYFLKPNRLIGCHGAIELSARWNITKNFLLTVRHNSNSGVCEMNRGQDMLSVGWRFGKL